MSTPADTRRTRRRAATVGTALVGGCLCVSLVACSDADRAPRAEDVTAVSAATGTAPDTAEFDAPGAELGSPVPRASSESGPLTGSQPLDVLPADETRMTVSEVRTGSYEAFDRIVVELSGDGAPGWFVSTDDDPTADGSGLPLSYEGDTALVIDVRGVELPSDSAEDPTPVHDTAEGVVRSVDVQNVFEGTQRIVIGLDGAAPTYNVTLLDSPTRIVVDVIRPG
ncbi:AMIN domain-containing protein [Corynebacterium sp. USCH3]|uniref:AMIN-like domain-containing (lipo)protein n=1 Tax=Corynebacterium sp. USCH3 TaxID=3024840 RepID=UPI0030A31211